jgi:PTS system N-acetylgalactosamine-specific IIA component
MTSSAPGPAAVRRAVVIGHGDFSDAMVSAVQLITGKGDAFRAVSNRDLSAEAIDELLRTTIAAVDAQVIFTDLPAGSCTIAARRVARDTPGVVVVTGTNLSVLLAWALSPQSGVGACDRALERGRDAMAVLPGGSSAEVRGAH